MHADAARHHIHEGRHSMPITSLHRFLKRRSARIVGGVLCAVAMPVSAFAAGPWESAVSVLSASFTGPIARGLSLIAIVVGGVAFAFNEGDSKRMLAGIVFGIGMAIGAANFLIWLFGG